LLIREETSQDLHLGEVPHPVTPSVSVRFDATNQSQTRLERAATAAALAVKQLPQAETEQYIKTGLYSNADETW
jgi:hypothetical protein